MARCRKHWCQSSLASAEESVYLRPAGRYYDLWVFLRVVRPNTYQCTAFTLCKQHSAEALLPTLDLDPVEVGRRTEHAARIYEQTRAIRQGGMVIARRKERNPMEHQFKARRRRG